MRKSDLQAYLINAYLAEDKSILTTQVYQDRPNTFALVTYVGGVNTEGFPIGARTEAQFGFAKCCGVTKRHGPDVWDAEYGCDMAIRKAIAKLAKKYGDNGNG